MKRLILFTIAILLGFGIFAQAVNPSIWKGTDGQTVPNQIPWYNGGGSLINAGGGGGSYWGVSGNTGTSSNSLSGTLDGTRYNCGESLDTILITCQNSGGDKTITTQSNSLYIDNIGKGYSLADFDVYNKQLTLTGNFTYQDNAATFGMNKVLTSNFNGDATWQTPTWQYTMAGNLYNTDTIHSVGINTAAPYYNLDVAGSMRDSLGQLQFINGHLPLTIASGNPNILFLGSAWQSPDNKHFGYGGFDDGGGSNWAFNIRVGDTLGNASKFRVKNTPGGNNNSTSIGAECPTCNAHTQAQTTIYSNNQNTGGYYFQLFNCYYDSNSLAHFQTADSSGNIHDELNLTNQGNLQLYNYSNTRTDNIAPVNYLTTDAGGNLKSNSLTLIPGAIVAQYYDSAQTSSSTIITYTVGNSNGTFTASGSLNVTTIGTGTVTQTVSYTDEFGTAQSATIVTAASSVSNNAGTPRTFGAKAGTNITITTTAIISIGGVAYSDRAYIQYIGTGY